MQIFDKLNNNIIYVVCIIIISLIGLYFLLVWQIRENVRDELKQIMNNRNKKRKILKSKQQKLLQIRIKEEEKNMINDHSQDMNQFVQNDIDSYIDPAEGYQNDNQNDNEYDQRMSSGYSGNRLSKDDIMMRDIADGTR